MAAGCIAQQNVHASVDSSADPAGLSRTEHSLFEIFNGQAAFSWKGSSPRWIAADSSGRASVSRVTWQSPDKQAGNGRNQLCLRSRLTSRSRRNPPSSFGLVALRDEDEREGKLTHRPEIGRGYPLNLSISLSGGKETNQDSLSNGE